MRIRHLPLVALVALLAAPLGASAQPPASFRWLAFAQLSAERVSDADDAVAFDADRLRARFQLDRDRLTAAIQFDVAVSDPGARRPGSVANAILDVFAAYDFSTRHSVRFGQFKTPLGMDFNVSGHSLDITQRGMEAGLVLNRDFGVMVSGASVLQGLSYDIGLFNPAGRSQAARVVDAQVGQDHTPVARLRYDMDRWHAELAHGVTERAGGPGSSDYSVTDAAFRYTAPTWTVKAEWIEGNDVLGEPGRRERVYYVHGAYSLSPTLELVARHYRGDSRVGGVETRLGNTYVGFTKLFSADRSLESRLQVNYVRAGGDRLAYTGVRGFRDDAIFVQWQIYAEM